MNKMRFRLIIEQPHFIFVFIGLIWGLFMLAATPPFAGCDEPNHFYRAFQVAEGGFLPVKKDNLLGGNIPASLIHTVQNAIPKDMPGNEDRKQNLDNIFKLMHLPLNVRDRQFVSFHNTAVYSPITYLPQYFAINIGKLFDASPIALFYAARAANLIFWLVMVFFAIKTAPYLKWILALLALTPMAMFQASVLSSDGVVNGLSFLFVAQVLKHGLSAKQIDPASWVMLAIHASLLAIAKYGYAPMVFFIFYIPVQRFKSIGHYGRSLALFFLISLIPAGLWLWVIKTHYFVPLRLEAASAISFSGQIQFILHHPFSYAMVLLRTYYFYLNDIVVQFIGVLGWLDTELHHVVIITYVDMLFFFGVNASNESISLSNRQRLIAFAALLLGVVGMSTASYVAYNPVGSDMVRVLQGRYFIPFAPLAFLLFKNNKVHLIENRTLLGAILACYCSYVAIHTSLTLIQRYYLT